MCNDPNCKRFPEAAPERVCAGCTPVPHGVKFIKGCPVHDPLPPPEPSGNAGLDSPPGTGSPSSNAAEKAASGRARGEDATTPPTPSAGERCKHTKVWKPSGECVDCGTQTGAFLEPCPHGNGVGCPYCIYEDAKKEAGRVPTPSAGEEVKLPRHPYRYDCFCDACEGRRRVIEGIELPAGVSAGETKPSPFGVSMEELVGARPEEGNAPMVRCDRCGGSYRSDTIHGCLPACTACACPRCENERAFVRIVAELHLDSQKDHRDSKRNAIFHRLVAAARKVVDGRP